MAGVAPAISGQMERDGVKPPETLSNQPRLRSNLVCYLDAFYDLDTERNHAHGLMRIPWSAINRYGEYHGYQMDELHYFIRRMDDELLASLAAKKGGASGAGSDGSLQMVQRPPRPD